MKNTRGFLLLLIFLFIGNIISYFLPLKIPGSIVGMILMLIFLSLGLVKLREIEDVSQVLIDNMIIIFLPGIMNLITIYPKIAPNLAKLLLITMISTFFVIGVTGFTVQKMISFMEGKKNA